MPPPPVTLEEIANLGRELAEADYCNQCDQLITRIAADLARFATQIYELYVTLSAERMRSANLEAAIRAAIGAHDDGETDPFSYLRDELAGITEGAHGA